MPQKRDGLLEPAEPSSMRRDRNGTGKMITPNFIADPLWGITLGINLSLNISC